jgi:hypothetical protein
VRRISEVGFLSDGEALTLIVARLGEIHKDIGDLYKRVDGLLSKEDCEKCKSDREKSEEKRHSVSPRVALAATIGGGIVGSILYRIPWGTIWRFFRGG